jgi:hypothetical protein
MDSGQQQLKRGDYLMVTPDAVSGVLRQYPLLPGATALTLTGPYVMARDFPQEYWPGHGPGEDHPGVYLFFGDQDELLYVGSAVGLASRISQYFRRDARGKAEPTSDKSLGVRYVYTVCLPPGLGHIAPGLERYLIEALQPPRNQRR